MTQQGSTALTVIGWISLAVAGASALAIVTAMARGARPKMAVMALVWPITALYWAPAAVWAFLRRRGSKRRPWSVAKGVSHCGAGCTLGDIAGEWLVFGLGLSFGLTSLHKANVLVTNFAFDFAFAWLLGIAFQYFSIVPMRDDVGRVEGIWQAVKADTLSIVAFQVGLFAYMALYHLVLWKPPLSVASPAYWWQMQIGMIVGFFTAWPVNTWLIRRGWKEAM